MGNGIPKLKLGIVSKGPIDFISSTISNVYFSFMLIIFMLALP